MRGSQTQRFWCFLVNLFSFPFIKIVKWNLLTIQKIFLNKQVHWKKGIFLLLNISKGKKASHSHNTENRFSKSCFNSTEIQTGVAIYAHYWLHTRSGKKKTQLATACKSEQAEKGDKPFYCYTLTRKNLEVKHHREKQTANMTEMQRWHHACYQSRGFSSCAIKEKGVPT